MDIFPHFSFKYSLLAQAAHELEYAKRVSSTFCTGCEGISTDKIPA